MIRKLLLGVLALILVIISYYVYMFATTRHGTSGPKQTALTIKKHSGAFNQSVANILSAYFEMKSAFVEADTAAAKSACTKMLQLTDSLDLAELKKDTTGIFASDSMSVENIRSNAKSLLIQTDITEMRKDFSMVNESLYPFLKGINYEGPSVYWQNCPMAFGEGKEANWISNSTTIANPYLGKKHPTYGSGMLHCGEVKDTIKAQ